MFVLAENSLKWEKKEWRLFIAVFLLLILYPLMNGYPFISGDTWRYASGEITGTTNVASPVLGFVMRPAIVIGGPWGFIVAQTAAVAFMLVFLSNKVLQGRYLYGFYFATILACVGIYSGLLMSDVWTLVGLISLFSICVGHGYPVIALFLALCYSFHYGHFAIFTVMALLIFPFAKHKRTYITTILSCLIGGVILVVTVNLFGGELRFGPPAGSYVLPASRILHDIPEVIDRKCQEDPGFKLCKLKEEIHKWSQSDSYQALTWRGAALLGIGVASNEFDELSREVVYYSLKYFFAENLAALVRNTYQQLSAYRISDGFSPFTAESWPVQGLKKYFPDDLEDYEKSWQANSRVYWGLKKMEKPLTLVFWLSAMTCVIYAILQWKTKRMDDFSTLPIFSLLAVLVNAFFTSNLSGVYGRFNVRIGFILIFPAIIIWWKFAENMLNHHVLSRKSMASE